mgnify:CR=1 FL=1
MPPVQDRKLPVKEDSPRDLIARRDWDAIQAWRQEHPDDVYSLADRIAGFLLRNRTTRPGEEAVRMLAELRIPSRVNSPLAHWTFDDNSGTSARDSASVGPATLNGRVRFVAGRIGSGAVAFDGGRTDYVDLGSSPALDFGAGAPFTIAGWFRTTKAYATLVSFRNANDDSTALDIVIGNHGAGKAPGRLMAIVRQDGGSKGFGDVIGRTANDGAWHHFALARNGEGTIRLYVDGAFEGMHTAAESGGALTTNLRSCGLEVFWVRTPKSPDDSGQGLKGEMDDLRIYGCALTAKEVAELAGAK